MSELENTVTKIEAEHLREEVRSLQRENAHLREFIAGQAKNALNMIELSERKR